MASLNPSNLHDCDLWSMCTEIMQALEEEGKGRVLVVDTGASMRCAVLGDNLAAMGAKNGWSVCLRAC